MVEVRQPVPGPEARELAFRPRKLENYQLPSLVIYGAKDRWIRPGTHRKLSRKLKEMVPEIEIHEIKGAGHLTLASDRRMEVIHIIKKWIESH